MSSLPTCPGRHRITDYSRKWYIPPGKDSTQCTYCEACYTQFVKDVEPNANEYRMQTDLYQCNCDYPKNYEKYALELNNLRVSIMSKDGVTMFPKIENDMANLNGVVHIAVPTCTEYIINIDNLNDDFDSYISFKSGTVGSKSITINDGRRIYYPSSIEVKGFKTGTNESFMFISQSEKEKMEGKVLEGENETNVITLNIKRWEREQRRTNFFESTRGYPDYMTLQCGNGGGSRSRGIAKGGGPESCTTSRIAECSLSSLSGGATVSGGSHVSQVRTTSTSDKFTDLDQDTEIVIQLVCTQTDEEKYETNKKYYLKKAMKEREELEKKIKRSEDDIKYYENQITSLLKKMEDSTKTLDELKENMKQYDYLGSTNKNDYLMDFNEPPTKVVKIDN